MGTNYYVKTGTILHVKCNCGFDHDIEEELHIGKNSYGWLFSLHIIPEKGICELKDWIPILWRGKIRNEYGEDISCPEMVKTILKEEKSLFLDLSDKERDKRLKEMNKGSFYSQFYKTIMEEDSGLLRVNCNQKGVDGNYCLVEGEFS